MTDNCENADALYDDDEYVCDDDCIEPDELDYCYECTCYGDDYSYNEETGELESNCDDCPFNGRDPWDD